MKLVLIYPDILKGAGWSGYFYSGVGYLSTAAKRAGHEVSFAHVTRAVERENFMALLAEKGCFDDGTLIAFSATTNMFGFVQLWSSWIKQESSNVILVGGVHPTLNPEAAIEVEGIDALCVGEGEEALVEFMAGLGRGGDISKIGSIWLKDNGKVYRNAVRPIIADLDALGFADRSIYDYANLDREKEGIGVFMASRGCPYNCYYCCNHAIRESLGGAKGYTRFRSVDNVISEIKQVVSDYPFIKYLHFDDDILPINKKWFAKFSHKYGQEVGLPFECNVRPNLLDETVIEQLRGAGCRTLRLGLESGNAFIRNKVLNRQLSEETIVEAARLCRGAGIRVYTFNMVGLPMEDMAARLDTVKCNARINSDEEQVSMFYPYEKTKLYDICRDKGLLRTKEVVDSFMDTSLAFSRGERNQIVFTAYYFNVLVRLYKVYYKLPGWLGSGLIRMSDAFFCSAVTARVVYPPLMALVRFLRRHKRLEGWARKIKHKVMSVGRSRDV